MTCLLTTALLLVACGGGEPDAVEPAAVAMAAESPLLLAAAETRQPTGLPTMRIAAASTSTSASAAVCRYEAKTSFGGACSALISATWSDGETISFANTRSGYSGSISATCSAGRLSWSSGSCQATGMAKTGAASAPDLSRLKVFTATPPFVVETKAGARRVQLGMYGSNDDVPRSHDFVGPIVNRSTGKTDVLTVQTTAVVNGAPTFVNLSDSSTPQAGEAVTTGRYELRDEGLHLAYLANDPPSSEKLRTQVNSWPIPTRRLLTWDLSVRFAGSDGTENWPVTRFTASPVLIWQLKSDPGFPPMGLLVDVDPENPGRALQLTFFQRDANVQAYARRWVVGGVDPKAFNDIVIQAVPDDRETSEGGVGRLKLWLNKTLILSTSGRNLIPDLPELNRWAFGLYMTAESEASPLARHTTWRRARLLVEPS